ncbi:MAG: hypothetical protein EOQ55_12535 [Mesorhizobium sp.]|uniref:hypothetical protein n=1 Tax=Mesorhizobium sp. TaxID=1871066 RepID=UPI000FE752F5|nr:hypothetical protein [Mesorhizobium sp.]RWG20118.1 MAG: hypothetical protein EOQ55_12535 [Mesorhizobium sp.]
MSNERPFTMVFPKLHSSKRYLSLDDSGRLLHHYFLDGPHQNHCGCYLIKPAYAATDLVWPVDKFLEYRRKLADAELIDFDPETDEIYGCAGSSTMIAAAGNSARPSSVR